MIQTSVSTRGTFGPPSEGKAAPAGGSPAFGSGSWRVLAHEKAADRMPPNHYDLDPAALRVRGCWRSLELIVFAFLSSLSAKTLKLQYLRHVNWNLGQSLALWLLSVLVVLMAGLFVFFPVFSKGYNYNKHYQRGPSAFRHDFKAAILSYITVITQAEVYTKKCI